MTYSLVLITIQWRKKSDLLFTLRVYTTAWLYLFISDCFFWFCGEFGNVFVRLTLEMSSEVMSMPERTSETRDWQHIAETQACSERKTDCECRKGRRVTEKCSRDRAVWRANTQSDAFVCVCVCLCLVWRGRLKPRVFSEWDIWMWKADQWTMYLG